MDEDAPVVEERAHRPAQVAAIKDARTVARRAREAGPAR
jgi:hypothetical protein